MDCDRPQTRACAAVPMLCGDWTRSGQNKVFLRGGRIAVPQSVVVGGLAAALTFGGGNEIPGLNVVIV